MNVEDFNKKYQSKNLFSKILSTKEEYETFSKDPELKLDYRFNLEHIGEDIKCNSEKIITQTFILFENENPVGVSTLVIEPRSSFEKIKGIKIENGNFKICQLTEVLKEIPDFAIIRGWRVVKKHLRGQGIGFDLRNLVTNQISKVLEENNNLKFGFWGMAAGPSPIEQQEIITKTISQNDIGDSVDLRELNVNVDLLGIPSSGSLPAFIGYIKDGYTYKPGFFLPKSYGALLVQENKTT